MNRANLIYIVAFSIGLFFTLITASFANTGTFIVDQEIVEEVTLNNKNIIAGNITAINGTVDFFMENPAQEILFCYNKTEFRDFTYTSTSDGKFSLHFINPDNSPNVTVKLEYYVKETKTIVEIYAIDEIDVGGLFSLGLSIVIVYLIFRYRTDKQTPENDKKGLWKTIKSQPNELGTKKTFVWLMFILASVFALWLSTRQILRLTRNYLFIEGYNYNQFEILSIIAYALTINLVFTLLNSLYKSSDRDKLDFTFSATIQAVLIGIILLLPRYAETETINRLGANGFAFILISMSILLAVLVFARKYLNRHSSYPCYI